MNRYVFSILLILGALLNCSFNYNTSDAIILTDVADLVNIDSTKPYKGKYILFPVFNKELNKTEIFCYNESEDVSYMDHKIFHRDHSNKFSHSFNYIHSEYNDTTYNHTDIFSYDFGDFSLTLSTRDLEPMISHMINYKGVEIVGVLGNDLKDILDKQQIKNEKRIN